MSKFPVFREFLDTIVDAAIFSKIGISFIEEALYELLHFWYESRDWRYGVSFGDIELIEICQEFSRIVFCEFLEGFLCLLAITYCLVIDIRDIHHGAYLVSEKSERTDDKILKKICPEIPDMSKIIGGWSTVVDFYFILLEGLESFRGSSESIVDMERHKNRSVNRSFSIYLADARFL